MSAGEFEVIRKYFKSIAAQRKDVLLGIGDDAAITAVPAGHKLVTTVDTLVEAIHFDEKVTPEELAHKAIAVNLSDLAAMGAEPAWITLSLTIPGVDHDWLQAFSGTIESLCRYYDIQLIGGDTCRGRISVTIQAMGFVPDTMAIRRNTAQAGDLIYVSGTLGDAGAGLQLNQQNLSKPSEQQQYLMQRLHKPTPRLAVGIHLRQFASAAIDVSDGLLQDLQHILDSSHVGAVVNMNSLPLSEQILHEFSPQQAHSFALTAGDDYELCFTVHPDKKDRLEKHFAASDTAITQIGHVTSNRGLRVMNKEHLVEFEKRGHDHFHSVLKA